MGLLDIGSALAQVDQFKRRLGLLASDPSAFAASHGGAELGAAPSQAGGLLSVVPQVREDAITQAMQMTPALLGALAPGSMTAGQINKELDKLDAHSSKITDALINAGRGSQRPSEMRGLTDPLSLEFWTVQNRLSELRDEIARRYGPGAPYRLPAGFKGR